MKNATQLKAAVFFIKTIKRTQYPSRVLRPFCVLDMEFFSRINDKIRIMEHTVRRRFF